MLLDNYDFLIFARQFAQFIYLTASIIVAVSLFVTSKYKLGGNKAVRKAASISLYISVFIFILIDIFIFLVPLLLSQEALQLLKKNATTIFYADLVTASTVFCIAVFNICLEMEAGRYKTMEVVSSLAILYLTYPPIVTALLWYATIATN